MDLPLSARGFLLGLSIAAVLGPIGLLCVRRTLVGGFAVGFVSGLGAATADAGYAAIAGFGVSAVAAALVDQRVWLRLIGGAFLVYLGVRTMRSMPAERSAEVGATRLPATGRGATPLAATGPGATRLAATELAATRLMATRIAATRLLGAYISTLALTLSNPMTILSFAGLFAGIGLGSVNAASADAAFALVLGVFAGSAAWWLVLASVTVRLRSTVTARRLRMVNLASGLLILVFGVQALASAF